MWSSCMLTCVSVSVHEFFDKRTVAAGTSWVFSGSGSTGIGAGRINRSFRVLLATGVHASPQVYMGFLTNAHSLLVPAGNVRFFC